MDPNSAISLARLKFRAALTELAQLDKSDLDAALRVVLATDADLLQVERVSFWELAPDHSAIRCRLLYRRTAAEFDTGGELRAADFPAYFEAMLETRTIVAHDAWTDPRTMEFVDAYFRPHDIRSMLDVPVWRRGKLAGVICHEHVGDARRWKTDEQDFCAGIGNMVSVALEAKDRRRAEEGYALVARATNDVVWDWDITRDIMDWNEAIYAVFRYRPDEVTPTAAWWLERVHAGDRERVHRALYALLDSDGTIFADQYRWVRGDGSIATVMDRALVVRDEEGRAIRMVGSMVDISERAEMQARVALSDRMASIGTLAAGVAHEINNPLTYIKANLACAIDDVTDGNYDRDALLDLLRDAQEGADRVRRIVRDLQVFSRTREDDVENLDVAVVVEGAIKMASNEIRHRAQLVKELDKVPAVRMNRARLGQVVLNLLVNAAQAIEEGKVEGNQIRVATSTNDAGEVVIEIHDTGCGIAAPILPRVFEPFFTTKPVGVGTGLGLSICHTFISAAGGRIDLESPPSGGCRARVTLPGVAEVVRPSREALIALGRRRRVLVVDDEAPIRRVVRRMLEPAHEVVIAESGEGALAQLTDGSYFDVILCDLMMPKMTGIDVYERLCSMRSAHTQRIIFMTGGAFSKRSSDFLAECACPIIEKPFDLESLGKAFAQIDGR